MNIVYRVINLNRTISALKLTMILSAVIVAAAFIFIGSFGGKAVFKEKRQKIIIDAGHGLPDGGAVASDGTIESDLNLAIAKHLYEKLHAAGFECIMLRNDENSIYTEGNTIHAKKVSDIKNRVETAAKNDDAFVVSIHMNTFETPDVHGAQVFYKSGSSISKDIAVEIQNIINLKYQPDNTKVSKPIPSNVYLFNHINNDSVLVECGFLTNNDDLSKLKDADFQEDISKSIAEVITYKLSGSETNVE